MSSGKFAVNLVVLEVYARAVAASRGLGDSHARHLSSALSAAFASGGGFISPDAIRSVTAQELSGTADGRRGHFVQPQPQSQQSAWSPGGGGGGGGGGNEDPYYGSSAGFTPSSSDSAYGGSGGGKPGSTSNPLVVSVAPGRVGLFQNFLRLVYLGVGVAIVYQVFFTKGGGLAGPLAQLTGEIVEEVTDVPTTRFADVKVRAGAVTLVATPPPLMRCVFRSPGARAGRGRSQARVGGHRRVPARPREVPPPGRQGPSRGAPHGPAG